MWILLLIVAYGYSSQQIGGFSNAQTCEAAFESIKRSQADKGVGTQTGISTHYCVEVK